MEQVNRLFSYDALFLILIIVLIYQVILLRKKEWKAILVFHTAGILNFLLEIGMIINGSRIVESNEFLIIFLTLFTLSWIDIGLFTSLAYINVNYIFKNTSFQRSHVLLLNVLFFVGMPLASLNWGIFNTTVLTRRLVIDPVLQLTFQVLSIVIVSALLFFTGYKRLIFYLLIFGMILGSSFQTRLYLAGIRQASVISTETLIIDTMSLATMPILGGALLLILFRKVDFMKFGDPPPLPKNVMNLRITLAAAKVLIAKVGLKTTLSLVKELNSQKKRMEPWKDLPEPKNNKDIESRSLIRDAILMYRSLLKRMDEAKALMIIKETILKSSIMQLYSLVPVINQKEILSKSFEERKEFLTSIINKFPNTDWELLETTENSFAYRITRCRLVELVNEVGHPELSEVFCQGDKIYFEKFLSYAQFSRPTLIGAGDNCCDFIFKLK